MVLLYETYDESLVSVVPDYTSSNINLAAIRRLFRELHRPIITTNDIATAFGITPQAANYQLKRFEREGIIVREKLGAAAVVYWLPGSSTNSNETEAAI
jgi:DNA-binding MarR family transcriptional regulator